MNLTIPYQTLEIGRIHMNPFQRDAKGRSISQLLYNDSTVNINDFILLSPPLRVIEYDRVSGRLRLDTTGIPQFVTKFSTLQQYIVSTLFLHRLQFFQYDYSHADIETMFQPLMDGNLFSIFVYPATLIRKQNGETMSVNALAPGDVVRFPMYIHGVMLLSNIYNPVPHVHIQHSLPRLRIQHNIPYMWLVTE